MPTDHATPVNALDANARRAFAWAARQYDVADWHDVDARTVARIAAGKRDVPPGLAREVGDYLHAIEPRDSLRGLHACALIDWANSREQSDG